MAQSFYWTAPQNQELSDHFVKIKIYTYFILRIFYPELLSPAISFVVKKG